MILMRKISSRSAGCTTSVHHDQFVCEEWDIDIIVMLKTPKSHNLINKKGTIYDEMLEIDNKISSLDVALDPAVVQYGKPNEQVKVIHEKLQSVTGIPMIECCLIYCCRQLQWERIPEFIVNLFVPVAYPASPSKFYTTGSNILSYLNESHDVLAKEPCPFKKLEYSNLIPPPNTPAVELLESVKTYFLKKCPEAVVDAMYRSSTVIGVACKNKKFAVSGNMSQLERIIRGFPGNASLGDNVRNFNASAGSVTQIRGAQSFSGIGNGKAA